MTISLDTKLQNDSWSNDESVRKMYSECDRWEKPWHFYNVFLTFDVSLVLKYWKLTISQSKLCPQRYNTRGNFVHDDENIAFYPTSRYCKAYSCVTTLVWGGLGLAEQWICIHNTRKEKWDTLSMNKIFASIRRRYNYINGLNIFFWIFLTFVWQYCVMRCLIIDEA